MADRLYACVGLVCQGHVIINATAVIRLRTPRSGESIFQAKSTTFFFFFLFYISILFINLFYQIETKSMSFSFKNDIKYFYFHIKSSFCPKAGATDMRYFAGSKFSRCLIHTKKIGLLWQVVSKWGYLLCQRR